MILYLWEKINLIKKSSHKTSLKINRKDKKILSNLIRKSKRRRSVKKKGPRLKSKPKRIKQIIRK